MDHSYFLIEYNVTCLHLTQEMKLKIADFNTMVAKRVLQI